MKLVSPVKRVVITDTGHTYSFEPDEPVEVAYVAVKDCLSQGCYPDKNVDVSEKKEEPVVELQGPDRDEAIREAIEKLITRNGRDDFTGTGKPDLDALKEMLGFRIDAKERESHWKIVLDNMAAE